MNSPSTLPLSSLRELANEYVGPKTHVYLWLISVGVLPPDHVVTKKSVVRLGGNPDALDKEYLAATAREWDDWGTSLPVEFVTALEGEYGEKHEATASILAELGRD